MMVDDASKPVVVDEALLDDLAEKAKAAELLAMQRRLLAVLQDPDHATLRAWVETVPPLVIAALVEEVQACHRRMDALNEAHGEGIELCPEFFADGLTFEEGADMLYKVLFEGMTRDEARAAMEAGHE